jgi:IS5 family transposase
MLLVGYCYGIRSERRLCEEVHLNLAYRWFCRLGLDGEVPDHSTFSKNRHGRFRDCDLLRKLFETVVRRCMAEGLVDGAAFAVDASLIAADANKQRSAAGSDDVDWEAIARTRRSVREYLDTRDEAAWGAASETVPKFISKSDPAAQWTGAHKGHAFFAYADNYLIDLKAAIIVDVEATRAIGQAEVGAARTMIERTDECLGLCPERLAADSAYRSAETLGCSASPTHFSRRDYFRCRSMPATQRSGRRSVVGAFTIQPASRPLRLRSSAGQRPPSRHRQSHPQSLERSAPDRQGKRCAMPQ